jgi:hypothetical protein
MIPGAIMIISGISTIVAYRYNREKVLSALSSYDRISVEQLANELGMQKKDVKETVIDLRTEGQLRASFEPESGDVIVLAVRGQKPITSPRTATTTEKKEMLAKKPAASPEGFCPYCGSMVKPGDRFCNNCGSAL